jgi:hypothetical protein
MRRVLGRLRRAWARDDIEARSYMQGGCAMPANTERLIFAGDPAAREARARMRRGSKTY